MDRTRLDTWLWAARLYKTRSQAKVACDAGHVYLNDAAAKPAHVVKPTDTIRARAPSGLRILRVLSLSDTRGPPPIARALYDDLTPPPLPTTPAPTRDRGTGRPTKRDRRELSRLRGD